MVCRWRHFVKLPNFTVCVVCRRAAMLPPALSDSLPFWTSSLTGQLVQLNWTARSFKLSRSTKSEEISRGGVSRPPWRGNNGLAALSRTPWGQRCPGASLLWGGSWSSFITLFPTSVQNFEHWIQRARKNYLENRYPEIFWDLVGLWSWISLYFLSAWLSSPD